MSEAGYIVVKTWEEPEGIRIDIDCIRISNEEIFAGMGAIVSILEDRGLDISYILDEFNSRFL